MRDAVPHDRARHRERAASDREEKRFSARARERKAFAERRGGGDNGAFGRADQIDRRFAVVPNDELPRRGSDLPREDEVPRARVRADANVLPGRGVADCERVRGRERDELSSGAGIATRGENGRLEIGRRQNFAP
jgi:hypothetical protein